MVRASLRLRINAVQLASQARHDKAENRGAGTSSTGSTEPLCGHAARRRRLPGGRMARAQRRGRRRFPGTSWKNAPSPSGLGHWRNDCVGRATARIKSAPNHRDLRRQTTRALRRNSNACWKAIAEETERAAACGDTRKLYQVLR